MEKGPRYAATQLNSDTYAIAIPEQTIVPLKPQEDIVTNVYLNPEQIKIKKRDRLAYNASIFKENQDYYIAEKTLPPNKTFCFDTI